jgi:hypothetical protein
LRRERGEWEPFRIGPQSPHVEDLSACRGHVVLAEGTGGGALPGNWAGQVVGVGVVSRDLGRVGARNVHIVGPD